MRVTTPESAKSCVFYQETRLITLEKLVSLQDSGLLSLQPSVSPEVLARIRQGISISRTIKPKYIDILLEQEVIE